MNTDTSYLTDRLPATATGTITHHLSEDVERSLDSNDPAVRRVVYNLYRGLLGTYNDKANCMLSALPPERVREDHGITRQLESMVNQTTQSGGGNLLSVVKGQPPPTSSSSMASSTGNGAPPLPPPLPAVGLPSVRINSEAGAGPSVNHGYGCAGAKHMPGGGHPFSYIPPSAIQNAMLTKDKKPFTYTPGGLDLSEIRSPRMVRRISKNAMDEGVASCPIPTSPPSSGALSPLYLPPQAVAAMQPQLAVPVFPPMPPPPPPPPPSVVSLSPNYVNFPPPPAPLLITSPYEEKPSDVSSNCLRSPSPPPPPPPSSLFIERTAQLGSIYIPPVTSHNGPTSPSVTAVQPTQLSKTPMPWMNSQNCMQSQSPPLFAPLPSMVKQGRTFSDTEDPFKPVTQSQVRIIPLHIEGHDSPPAQQNGASLNSNLNTNMNKSNDTARVVPIQLEADVTPKPVHYLQHNPIQPYSPPAPVTAFAYQNSPQSSSPARPAFVPQPPWRTNSVNNSADSANSTFQNLSLASPPPTLPSETRNPIQSRSFRILQMITDADEINAAQEPSCNNIDTIDSGRLSRASVSSWSSGGTLGRTIPGERRLELTQDDQQLMNLFKTQVSEDSYLHTEADPRYRGSHIPSRAFRCLQNFTETSNTNGTTSSTNSTRVTHYAPVMAQTMRQGEATYSPSGPPSEQTEPEPRKYMGGNIPSRSFRILQAMTATDPPVQDDDGYVSHASEVNSPEDQIASSKIPSSLKHTIPHFAQKNQPISFAEKLEQVCQNPVLRGASSKIPPRLFHFLQESFDPTTSGADAIEQLSTPDIIVQAYERIEQLEKMESLDETVKSKTINASFDTATFKPPSNDATNESQHLNSTSTQPRSGHSCLLSYFCSQPEPPSSVVSPVRLFSPSLLFQEMVFPASEEGKHLHVRSKRSRSHIPSRIFKFLQSEYDQDADPGLGSPPRPLRKSSSQFSLALDSFLPDTNSSGASEIEGFMGH